jgi:hypothetical protein
VVGEHPAHAPGIVVTSDPEGAAVHGDDDQLFAWVERDQFAYYLTIAYMTADPNDWPPFRRAIHGALVAALCLDRHLARDVPADEAPDELHAMRLLDDVRRRYNPAVTWAGFVLELWTRRHERREEAEHWHPEDAR